MTFNKVPIESLEGKPIYGMIIKAEQYDDLIKEAKKHLGNQFLIAKKPVKDGRLKVTFFGTAETPANTSVIKQKLGKIADGFQARKLKSSELEPTMISFPTKKR